MYFSRVYITHETHIIPPVPQITKECNDPTSSFPPPHYKRGAYDLLSLGLQFLLH